MEEKKINYLEFVLIPLAKVSFVLIVRASMLFFAVKWFFNSHIGNLVFDWRTCFGIYVIHAFVFKEKYQKEKIEFKEAILIIVIDFIMLFLIQCVI